MINSLPALIVIWAVFTGLFLALLAYNATITRYEEHQLFLDDMSDHEEQSQSAIIRKINLLQPYIRATGIISAISTVLVIGIYTWDAWQKLHQ